MARKTNMQIIKEHLILCEGRDEQEFLISYLNSAALADDPRFADEIQVIDFGGNDELGNYLKILMMTSDFEKVRSLLIVRDAEDNAQKAACEIQKALKKSGYTVPHAPCCWNGEELKTGFLLFPDLGSAVKNGTLEDLCLSILKDSNAPVLMGEIDNFMGVLKENYNMSFPREFKTKLHTYFSVNDRYVSLKIGEAAKAGAFEWESVALKPLRKFIEEIL